MTRRDGAVAFEEAWPGLAATVRRMLAAKRVPLDLHDDIVQETGLRLFAMWPRLDLGRPVQNLAVTIALNLARDSARMGSSHPVVGAVPDIADPADVERSALARVELGRVARALGTLRSAHRSVLLTQVDHTHGAPEVGPGALRVMRLRARRHLQAVLDRAGYALAPHIAQLREMIQRVFETPAVRNMLKAGALAAALALLPPSVVPERVSPRSPPHVTQPRPNGEVLERLDEARLVEMVSAPKTPEPVRVALPGDLGDDVGERVGGAAPDISVEAGIVGATVGGLGWREEGPVWATVDVAGTATAGVEPNATLTRIAKRSGSDVLEGGTTALEALTDL